MLNYKEKVRDNYLLLKKYALGNTLKSIYVHPLLILYVKVLKKEGAYSQKIIENIEKISLLDQDIALFCKAEILYLKGDFKNSLEILYILKNKYHLCEEIYYLIHKNYMSLKQTYKAQIVLYDLLQYSARKKTWLYLANSVETLEQYIRLKKEIKLSDIQLVGYCSEAALRAGQYKDAINLWADVIKKHQSYNLKDTKKIFSTKNAEYALTDLKKMLDQADIEFFLVSGTLLGCMRDHAILPHDKDLDVGIFEDRLTEKDLEKVIQYFGCFEILPTRIKDQFKLKHLNGTYIDIFIHKKINQLYWHYTAKIKWFNTPFKLKKITFLNDDFLIPENYQAYLCENYGDDWQTPIVNFDSNFDTPNAVILNELEMQVFYVKMLAYLYLKKNTNSPSFERLIKKLNNEVLKCLKKKSILVS